MTPLIGKNACAFNGVYGQWNNNKKNTKIKSMKVAHFHTFLVVLLRAILLSGTNYYEL